MSWLRRKKRPEISLLVPFRADDEGRARNWAWLRKYWECELPAAEIVLGKDSGHPFSKTAAVNHAAKRAKGRYFVILDADAFLDGRAIQEAVDRIKKAERNGHRLWFIPYRNLYRLTEEATWHLLSKDPCHPLRWFSRNEVQSQEGSLHGRRFGAMAQVMPREAFFVAGGMDPRFRGWGGEDVSFVRAVDTLWGKHKTLDANIFHLHHEKLGVDWRTRVWLGQHRPRVNENMATRYDKANNQYDAMRDLTNEYRGLFKRLLWWKR